MLMSIFGKVAKRVALAVGINTLDKASKKLETKSKESKKNFFEKQPGTGVLIKLRLMCSIIL